MENRNVGSIPITRSSYFWRLDVKMVSENLSPKGTGVSIG
jgi:hypothetical protein